MGKETGSQGEIPRLSFENALVRTGEVWKRFFLSARGQEDSKARVKELGEIVDLLSDEDLHRMTHAEEGGQTPLAEIRERMLKEANEELAKKRQSRQIQTKKLSPGEKLHIRRTKAQQHRGTSPKRIH